LGYRLTIKSQLHFDKEILQEWGIEGPILGELEKNKDVMYNGKMFTREDLSYWSKEKIFAYILDTGECDNIPKLMKNADAVLMEATYLDTEAHLAKEFNHMTAERAARYAKENNVQKLILTHFSERYKDLNICQKAVDKIYKNAHISHDFDEIEI
jgi:ribonuclease Z